MERNAPPPPSPLTEGSSPRAQADGGWATDFDDALALMFGTEVDSMGGVLVCECNGDEAPTPPALGNADATIDEEAAPPEMSEGDDRDAMKSTRVELRRAAPAVSDADATTTRLQTKRAEAPPEEGDGCDTRESAHVVLELRRPAPAVPDADALDEACGIEEHCVGPSEEDGDDDPEKEPPAWLRRIPCCFS